MVENEQLSAQEDEVAFRAQYSLLKICFSILVCIFPLLILFGAAYLAIAAGKYVPAVACLFLAVIILMLPLEGIFVKHLLFYRGRIVKVWYLFGQKTISYSEASVKKPDMPWLSSVHFVFQSRDNGKPVPMRLPIHYHSFFFASDTAEKIEAIMDYLTDDKQNNPRKFKRFTLPVEVV